MYGTKTFSGRSSTGKLADTKLHKFFRQLLQLDLCLI